MLSTCETGSTGREDRSDEPTGPVVIKGMETQAVGPSACTCCRQGLCCSLRSKARGVEGIGLHCMTHSTLECAQPEKTPKKGFGLGLIAKGLQGS